MNWCANEMIKNVIFDLGSVLINNDPSEYIKSLGFSEEKTKALNQALSSDSTWHDKDKGIYESYRDCIPIFQRNHPEFTEEIAMFFQDGWMGKIYRPIEENIILNEQELYKLNNYDLYSKFVLSEASDILNLTENEIISQGYKIYTYQDSKKQKTLAIYRQQVG